MAASLFFIYILRSCLFGCQFVTFFWPPPWVLMRSSCAQCVESTELHQSIDCFPQTITLSSRCTMTDLASALLFFLILVCCCAANTTLVITLCDFLQEKFGACYVSMCQFQHKTSPCRAVCLCDTTKEQNNSQTMVTRSLPASKWDWFWWNVASELSSLERCWQMKFCLVLFLVHIQVDSGSKIASVHVFITDLICQRF